ncbi:MAG: hypothetical protein ABJB32_02990, partial [Verrucomicrobiota bacterium]
MSRFVPLSICIALVFVANLLAREPQTSPASQNKILRARDLGIPFDGEPGNLNEITDVSGVEVGYTTLIKGAGKLEV